MNDNVMTAVRYFGPKIENPFGVAALVGGLYFISGCDATFGTVENDRKKFAMNGEPFGIGEWTEWTRKWSLYNFARLKGSALTDISMQLDFIMDEFIGTTYGPVLDALREAVSVREAAYLVYDRYLDIPDEVRTKENRETCANVAMEVYNEYFLPKKMHVPVKYVKTDKKLVRVKGAKKGKFPFLRKTLGYLKPMELYRFISFSDDGAEYALVFDGEMGYVDSEKVYILTRMEAV